MTIELVQAASGTTPAGTGAQRGTGGAGFVNGRGATEFWKSGTLGTATPFTISMYGSPIPGTLTLTSAAGGRLIQLSTDGVNYFSPVLDATAAGMINVSIGAAVVSAQVTGAAGDTWNVL